jgi:hypothetical protein
MAEFIPTLMIVAVAVVAMLVLGVVIQLGQWLAGRAERDAESEQEGHDDEMPLPRQCSRSLS